MPSERKRVWNLARQIPGNLIPLLLAAPFLVICIRELAFGKRLDLAAWYGLGFLGIGWLAVNFIGLIGNSRLKLALEHRFKDEYEYDQSERLFAGFSRPGKYGLLDPHEDVGFLVFREAELEFFGEVHRVSVPYGMVRRVYRRANIHSILGLGGWVAIDAEVGGKTIRLQVEPRVKNTHWGNARLRKQWIQMIESKISG